MIDPFPLDEDCIRAGGIDPSTQHMGAVFIDINLKTPSKFILQYAKTLEGEAVNYLAGTNFQDGNKVQSRIHGLALTWRRLCEVFNPTVGVCEDNYLGASPDTFKRLVEAVTLLRMETENYGNGLYLSSVKPNAAKDIVGASFKGTTKEDVFKGLLEYKRLDWNGIDPHTLDEHTYDAIAITLFLAELIAKDRGVLLDV